MRAGLYAWVSTDEEAAMSRQNDALLAYVTARGWTAICRIEDIGSEAAARPRRAELMKLARRPRWTSSWSAVWTAGATR